MSILVSDYKVIVTSETSFSSDGGCTFVSLKVSFMLTLTLSSRNNLRASLRIKLFVDVD